MFCRYCSDHRNHMVHLAETGEGDKEAIEDLRKQWIDERNPQMKMLLKMRLDILVKEVNTAQTFEQEMTRATTRLYRAIAEMIKQGQGNHLLSLSPADLQALLITEGLGDAIT